jgi:uncharacterized membrane protein YccC
MNALSNFPSVRGGPETGRSPRRSGLRWSLARSLALLWDQVASIDPGLLRLLLAARGTLSVGLTVAVLFALVYVFDRPITQFAFGVVLSMVGPFVMRDPTRAQRQLTLLLLLPPAAAAVVISSLANSYPPAGEVWLLLLVFVAALLVSRHPRALALGLIAVIMTYIGLYLHLPPSTLPIQIASLGIGAAVVWIVCFVILPVRPVSTLRRTVRSVRRRAGRVLREALEGKDPQHSVALRQHLTRLNTAALAAEDQLALLDEPARTDLRLHLFELERTVMRLIDLISEGDVNKRHWDRVRVTAERLRRGQGVSRVASPGMQSDPLRAALLAVAHASTGLDRAASRAVAIVGAPTATTPAPPGPFAWRPALQVTLASLVAMLGGMALSPQRWFWAVITVYVVFLNARSRGDTLYKGFHRIAGTVAGLFGGMLISTAAANNEIIICVVMLAAVFGIYYLYSVSYSVAIFCVTVLLGMVYGSLNAPLGPVLVLRFEETAIGVLAAGLAASFVWPIPTRHQVRLSGLAVLRSLRDVVRASLAAMDRDADPAPIEAVRRLDRQIGDLRLSLVPLNASRFLMGRARAERPLTALLACAAQARILAGVARAGASGDLASLRALGANVEARIAAMLSETPPQAEYTAPVGEGPAADALRQLDQALAMLSERLEANVIDGFAVD